MLLTLSLVAKSQPIQAWKYRIKGLQIKLMDNQNRWSEWAKPKGETNILDALVVLDLPKKKLTVYGPTERNYDFIEVPAPKEDEGNSYYNFIAIDYKNEKCSIVLTFLKGEPRKPGLHILYPKSQMLFTLEVQDY